MTKRPYDVCIVGGGLVGLAVGRALTNAYSGLALLLLEKEPRVAVHQSGHSSGVVHSGLYYQPGSLKAKLSVAGRHEMYSLSARGGGLALGIAALASEIIRRR